MGVFKLNKISNMNEESTVPEPDHGAGEEGADNKQYKIGVSLPYESKECEFSANALRDAFLAFGYEVDICNAQNDSAEQCRQIEYYVDNHYDVIIVWSIDGYLLESALDRALSEGIPIISFYSLIENSDAIKYFVGINFKKIGIQQAEFICNASGTNTSEVVIIFGPEYDSRIMEIYNGAMEIFDVYGGGILQDTILENITQENAYSSMINLLNDYGGENISAICCCIDLYATGVIQALCESGFNKNNMPIITSFGGSDEAVQNVIDGLQSMTIAPDFSQMVIDTVNAVNVILNGKEIIADEFVNNGNIDVPTKYVDGWPCSNDNPAKPEDLDYIEIVEPPTRTKYYTNEKFETKGMVVKAYLVTGASFIITNYNYSPRTLVSGDTFVTISYTLGDITKTTPQIVEVLDRTLVSIFATPARSYYLQGTSLSKGDFNVIANYDSGPTSEVVDFDFCPKTLGEVNSKLINFCYLGFTCSLEINVLPKLESINLEIFPNKLVYYKNERINRAGMSVKANYSNGLLKSVSNGSLIFKPNYANFKDGQTSTDIEVTYYERGIEKSTKFKVYKKTGVELDNCDVPQDMGASGTGFVNLSSGQITYKFEEFVGTDSNIPITIARVYKSDWGDNYVGKHWRLNLQQTIKQNNNGYYVYTDKEGKEYTFDNGYSTSDNRSSIRNEKLGLDLFKDDDKNEIKLVDRSNNTLIFSNDGTVYKLTAMHQYPSTPSAVVDAYSMEITYESGKISTVTAGKVIGKNRPKVIFNYNNDLLDYLEYVLGDNAVTVVKYEYSDGELIGIKKMNSNVPSQYAAETQFARKNDIDGNYISFTVKDLTSKDDTDKAKSLEYKFVGNKVSEFSIGYGEDNRDIRSITYTKWINSGSDKVYSDVISSTYIENKDTLSVTSFNSYNVVAQYSYKKGESYNKPKKVLSASSYGLDYKSFADSYSDTFDVMHSDFENSTDGWTGGGTTPNYSIKGTKSLFGTSLKKSYTFNTSNPDGETLYLSLWACSGAKFSIKLTVNDRVGEINNNFTNALSNKWQYAVIPLGRIKNNETINIEINGSSSVHIDDVRIIKAPYEVPDDIPNTETNSFGNTVKAYEYSPVDQKTACTEYIYNDAQQVTGQTVKVGDVTHSATEYGYNTNGLLTSQKSYGKIKNNYIEQKNVYNEDKVLISSFDENNVETLYSEGTDWTQSQITGETGSPTVTLKNTYYGISDFLKTVSSSDCNNQINYNNYGDISKAISGTEITFGYDSFGNVNAVKVGTDTLVSYDHSRKHLNKITYANGATIAYAYDNEDRVTKITESGATPITVTYGDDSEDTVTVTNGNGVVYESKTVNKGGITGEYSVTFPNVSRKLIVKGCALNGAGNVSTDKTYFGGDDTTIFEERVTTTDRDGLVTELKRSGHGASSTYSYDDLYRLSTKTTSFNSSKTFAVTYWYDTISGNRVSSRIEREFFSIDSTKKDEYSYDFYRNGNLKKISLDLSPMAEYEYDEHNRLVRENNYALGVSHKYEYDNNGNITSKKSYPITNGTISTTANKTDSYTYGNGNWKDQLTSYNGVAISYDGLGNPESYRGKTLQWRGRKLVNADGVAMEYDYNGLRLKKGNRIYYWQGESLKAERWEENGAERYIYYYYDENGVSGMNYNGTEYYYRKNVLGDVLAIYDTDGSLQCRYIYDAFGNHAIVDATGNDITSGIGVINPIRYRGYYYDTELDLYYLQSRYYDPDLGRFISADDVSYLDPQSVFGLNLYAYCGNDPANFVDPDGYWAMPDWLKWLIGGVVIAGLGIATIATGGAAAGVAGFVVAGAFKGAAIGAVSGALVSGTIGGISSTISGEGFWTGFANGAADGFMSGAIVGGVTGAISSGVQVANAAKSWVSTGGKTSYQQMTAHYTKHVINEGQKSIAKNIVNYTKQARSFFANNNASGYLLRDGVIKISGAPGGIFNVNGLIRSFWYI